MNTLQYTSIGAVVCIIFMSFAIIFVGIQTIGENSIDNTRLVLFGDFQGIFIRYSKEI